jgi:ribonuclease P protein component
MNHAERNKFNLAQGITFSLPKQEVLRGKTSFNRLFQHGKSMHGNVSSIRFLLFKDEAPHKLMSFIVKKKMGNAVLRNRLKRLLREVYRHHNLMLNPLLEKGYSIEAAFMVSKPSASITALNKDYETMIQRIVQIVDQSSTNA